MAKDKNSVELQQRMTNQLLVLLIRKLWSDTVTLTDLADLLSQTGATHEEIADTLGTTAATIQVTLHRHRASQHKMLRDRAQGQDDRGERTAEHDEHVRRMEPGE